VKPQRDKEKRKANRERWWQYAETRPSLSAVLERRERVLVQPFTTKYLAPCFASAKQVFASPLVILNFDDTANFAVLQSIFHETWVRRYASTMGERIRYSSSDCFETFPFPEDVTTLEQLGAQYHEFRKKLLLNRREGLTDIYNHFHDSEDFADDISRLRTMQVEMDIAVAAAYGWSDLHLGHGFQETKQGIRFTIIEMARRMVLDRLLSLNHQRREEEVKSGLHDKKGKALGLRGNRGRKSKEARAGATPALLGLKGSL